jgi:hypothetical protein
MKKLNIYSIILFLFVFVSCKKNNTGGQATLSIYTEHHGSPINGATIYIKFGAKDLPDNPTQNYDLKETASANSNHIQIEGLRYGDYYVYATGYDAAISEYVSGGVAIKIKWKERKKEIVVQVPVTE